MQQRDVAHLIRQKGRNPSPFLARVVSKMRTIENASMLASAETVSATRIDLSLPAAWPLTGGDHRRV
jgi:hypothetical protein